MQSTRSEPIARKKHWCEVCGWAIEPGEKYERVITFDGGDVLTWKSHLEPCSVAATRASAADYRDWDDVGVTADSVAEWANEYQDADEVAAELCGRYKINEERWRARREAEIAATEGEETNE